MCSSCIDRIKAEIITSQLKISWYIVTGSLDSIISIPENFEWVGKSEINILFRNKNGEKINYEITDLEFSEYYDEKSFGILQKLYWKQNQLRMLYYALNNLPVIFIKGELLINNPLHKDIEFIPFCFNINKEIKNIEKKEIDINNKKLAYIQSNTGNALLFYNEWGINLNIIDKKEIRTVYMGMQKNNSYNCKSIIQLPQIYICPINNCNENEILTLHYKIIDTHKKYEKIMQEKKE